MTTRSTDNACQDSGCRRSIESLASWLGGGQTRIPVDVRLAVPPSCRAIVGVNNTVKIIDEAEYVLSLNRKSLSQAPTKHCFSELTQQQKEEKRNKGFQSSYH
jgi:hypothetical protein